MPLVAERRVKVLRAEHSGRQLFLVEACRGRDTAYRVLPHHYSPVTPLTVHQHSQIGSKSSLF
jgi:hypothetical protein